MKLITLDRVKIKANNKYLLEKKVKFNEQYHKSTGRLMGEYYSSKDDGDIPFNVYVAVSYPKQTLTLEFSSKILKEHYPLLISKETIEECLDNLNLLGLCTIDVKGILETGCITSMDVTTDVPFDLSDEVLDCLNEQVGGYRRFKWRHYENEGIEFVRDVKSRDCKECIKFYRKGKEIRSSANRDFLKSLAYEQQFAMEDYFADKTRIEMSLNTQRKIKEYFKVEDTYISEVLNSTANPLLKQFDKIFEPSIPRNSIPICNDYETFAMQAILTVYNGDLKLIEQALKRMFASRSGCKKRMDKIEALKKERQNGTTSRVIISEVRSLIA